VIVVTRRVRLYRCSNVRDVVEFYRGLLMNVISESVSHNYL